MTIFFLDFENGNDSPAALTTVTVSNPSGSITRCNKTAHGLEAGEKVTLTLFTAWLNATWTITVVDADNFDLDGAVWQATADASGTVTPYGGSSKARAWKSLSSGATAVRTAPGDTIRIMASPDPVSAGNATWTDNSGDVTWASAKNKLIEDCETAWTASANVTASTSTARKRGSASASFVLSPGFTTGLVAYKTLAAALDLSAYQQISFWHYGAATTAGIFEIKLCSDTAGAVAVDTFAFPASTSAGWNVFVFDKGAALGSSIQSIALYATADPATPTFRLDNIVACLAASDANCITHAHAIGKNSAGEPEWYSILSISDTGITIGGASEILVGGANAPRPYRGTTETVATYSLIGINIVTAAPAAASRTIQDQGSAENPITFSGGWDRTNMTSQSGATYFNGYHYSSDGIIASSKSYISVEKIGGINLRGAVHNFTLSNGIYINSEQSIGCYAGPFFVSSQLDGACNLKFSYAQGQTTSLFMGSSNGSTRLTAYGKRVHGSSISSSQGAVQLRNFGNVKIDKIDNSGSYGLVDNTGSTSYYQWSWSKLVGCVFANNALGDIKINDQKTVTLLDGCTFSDVVENMSNAQLDSFIKATRIGGAADVHAIIGRYWRADSESTVRHTASGISWKVSPLDTSYCSVTAPANIPLAKVACAGGSLVTFKCWVRRTNTGISAGARLVPSDIVGDYTAHTQTLMTAAADTWEEITLTFTPTTAGVVEIMGIAYGGTTYSAYFDDMTVLQA